MTGIVALLVFAYVWGDIKVALCVALGFALAKMILNKRN